jgi:orotate phosphoribosyltransferase
VSSDRQRLLSALKQWAYEKREVLLSSGRRSNFYIDCRRVVLRAEGHYLVGRVLLDLILELCPMVVAVGGLSLGADPLASAVALTSYTRFHSGASVRDGVLDAFYVRKEAKSHGTARFIEGIDHLQPGAEVVILEDVITTGASSLLALERARESGLRPVRVIALVDRDEGGREEIEKQLPVSAIFRRGDFD